MNEIEDILKEYRSFGVEQAGSFEQSFAIALVHLAISPEEASQIKSQSQILIENGLTPNEKPSDIKLEVLEMLDHYEAYKFMIESAKERKPLSHSFLQKLNSLILARTGKTIDLKEGKYRTYSVSADSENGENIPFMPHEEVQSQMEKFINQHKDFFSFSKRSVKYQLFVSFAAHYYMVYIHPFGDGNGRASRLLMNYMQAYFDLPLCIINSERREQYIKALETADMAEDKERNYKPFCEYLLAEYVCQLTDEIAKHKKSCR